jgi:hypothetical protein
MPQVTYSGRKHWKSHFLWSLIWEPAGNTLSGYTEVARFTSSGLKLPSGNGIDFSATANSSGTMTSELLSDYEEGAAIQQ